MDDRGILTNTGFLSALTDFCRAWCDAGGVESVRENGAISGLRFIEGTAPATQQELSNALHILAHVIDTSEDLRAAESIVEKDLGGPRLFILHEDGCRAALDKFVLACGAVTAALTALQSEGVPADREDGTRYMQPMLDQRERAGAELSLVVDRAADKLAEQAVLNVTQRAAGDTNMRH